MMDGQNGLRVDPHPGHLANAKRQAEREKCERTRSPFKFVYWPWTTVDCRRHTRAAHPCPPSPLCWESARRTVANSILDEIMRITNTLTHAEPNESICDSRCRRTYHWCRTSCLPLIAVYLRKRMSINANTKNQSNANSFIFFFFLFRSLSASVIIIAIQPSTGVCVRPDRLSGWTRASARALRRPMPINH